MALYSLHTADIPQAAQKLRIFDRVLLSGPVYTARDAAHKRFFSLLEQGRALDFDLLGLPIYYAGPTPTPEGRPIGSCGPTTSGRMDVFAPRMLDMGLKCMIGKGERSQEVYDAIRRNGGVYLCALGGAGALAAKCVVSCQVMAFEDLGVRVGQAPGTAGFSPDVAADCAGGNLFAAGKAAFLEGRR